MNLESLKSGIRSRHKLRDDADVRLLSSVITVKNDEPSDPYKFTARITTDSIDRQNEAVIPQGGDLKEFFASGAIFWNHDYNQPVGFPNKMRSITRGENYIECGGIFMKRPADWDGPFAPDFAREFVTQAYQNGVSAGVSIGFVPLETRRASKADVAKWGERIQYVHSKWKLLEFSIAPVQANQDAFVTVVGKTLPAVPAPAPKVKVIEETLVIMRTSRPSFDIAGIVNRAVKRELCKEFGRIFV